MPFAASLHDADLSLVTLHDDHLPALKAAAMDPRIWAHHLDMTEPQQFTERWFDKARKTQQDGQRFPYTIFYKEQVVGSTSYYGFDERHKHITIGFTWYHPSCWGGSVNVRCKSLLLKYAFDTLNLNRVAFDIDALNKRSRAAVEKLGAAYEGTLRFDMVRGDGTIRDTTIYSIVRPDWPACQKILADRLASKRTP